MMIVILASAMCIAMLIATAFAIREEAERARARFYRHEISRFAMGRNKYGPLRR